MTKLNSTTFVPFIVGLLLTINFVVIWAIPIGGLGMLWKYVLGKPILKAYDVIDKNELLRQFAKKYIYSRPEHSDYFLTQVLSLINTAIMISVVFYFQINYGYVPAWMVLCYYCMWIGIGGRNMGAAYSFAHKEVIFYLLLYNYQLNLLF